MTQSRRYLTLAAIVLGMLPAALDQTVVDTAMPRMISELGGLTLWAWVISAYLLASTALVPVVGRLVDVYGRKRFFLGAVVLFVGASALCGNAHSMAQLILWRTLQGLGGGILFPIGSTLIGDLFPGPERSRLQGYYVGVFGLATVIGPQVGGWLVDGWGWRSVFYLNLPLGLLSVLLMGLSYRETGPRQRAPVDLAGAALATCAITLLVLGLQQGGNAWAWSAWQSIASLGGGLLCLLAFLAVERRAAAPVLDLRLFREPVFAVTCTVALLTGAAVLGAVLFVPWFLQGVAGVSATAAGGVLSPMMLALIVAAALSGQLVRRGLPYRVPILVGMGLLGSGYLLMTGFTVTTGRLYATGATVVAGLGAGLVMPLLNIAVQNAFPRTQRGVVTAATSTFRSLGSIAASALFMARFNAGMARAFPSVLEPALAGLPAPAAGGLPAFAGQPVQLIQLLLHPEAVAALPAAARNRILEAVRTMFTGSIHGVYRLGLLVCLAGMAAGLLLGGAALPPADPAEAEAAGWGLE